jgi:hypothetical protein
MPWVEEKDRRSEERVEERGGRERGGGKAEVTL